MSSTESELERELERIREALETAFISEDVNGEVGHTHALQDVARALERLGNNGAVTAQGTEMGALEAHGMAMIEASEKISNGLHDIADAIRESNRD